MAGVNEMIVAVTGGASGIGAAVCRRFAQAGARVAVLDMDGAGAAALAEEISARSGKAAAAACDVRREEQCAEALGGVIRRWGGIDVLVNNAGITQRSAFAATETHVYRTVMDVNFFGALYCTKAALESLVERRGLIVVMESIAGIAPLLGRSGYCASKHALHGFFTTLRAELRSAGVGVTLVCPGFVQTNLQDRALGGDGRVTRRPQSRVGRQMRPETVAEAVFRGAVKRKPLILLSPVGVLTYWLTRFTPLFYERLMARALKEELR
jgi:NAD(P)-dependent dehydrogenase (short-subunit alcohol dehydrogenase family)